MSNSRWRLWSAECQCGWFRDNYNAFADARSFAKAHRTKSRCGASKATLRDYGTDGVVRFEEVVRYAA